MRWEETPLDGGGETLGDEIEKIGVGKRSFADALILFRVWRIILEGPCSERRLLALAEAFNRRDLGRCGACGEGGCSC